MVGSPYQTISNLICDLRFLQKLKPDMIGIGPYITHADTPFAEFKSGNVLLTLRLVSILRLMFPYALIPSTTALGTIHPQGRELYENKICTGEEAAQCRGCLERRVESAGYKIVTDIGNVKKIEE